ncbi:hypothetical protein LTR54_014695 [Friedmanniomyces endolithicus]|uniref:Chitin-binding type-1 domain-containing protein n=1 Tax=Friedmanniomyces endolithicus TaxID=329885 RepID=A0AAN6J5I5_9PEZI|nr:hypothetical protein LTS00_013913 [Friedmanniomyces endolithicus]KAK0316953.1 hypothetical protein LTR82_012095 [Friedmanniomyces endolithicus]KAK0982465.1 hypothetical protein LTR54_014695 [Friedmanniomyces endolithicus]
MKLSAVMALVATACTSANIIFPFVQPTCNHESVGWTGCLRGQQCLEDNTCVPTYATSSLESRDTTPRTDGRCGSDFSGATCDPKGAYGGCCSKYGYCGKTLDHCLVSNGCQSGCTEPAGTTAAPLPTTAPASVAGPGVSNSEPVIGPLSSTAAGDGATGPVATDGTCGASKGGTMYGFCGKTSAHCSEGCQSGPCSQAPISPAPSAAPALQNSNPGSFRTVGQSGVPAMHAALLPNGRIVFLDKVENYTQVKLSNGQYAYSAEYDPESNTYTPLAYKTNAFCSGGSFLSNGTVLNVGGNAPLTWLDDTVGNGFQGIRYLTRSSSDASLDGENWNEPGNQLNTARWYPTLQTMPDGSIFVASGSLNGLNPTVLANNNPTYEILSAEGVTLGQSITMQLLVKAQPYYMYPFIHLLPDGTLFVFVSKSSETFDVANKKTTKSFPDLPGDYRTYPNAGGSVMLPLSAQNNWTPEVMICGGGAYQDITSPTDPSCGRIAPLVPNAAWEMDAMPEGRGMVEAVLLPDGTVLWVNGAQKGAEGFNLATDPAFEVLIYDPKATLGQRWTTGASSTIPRLYHSVALLLLDGTLMIAGSNPDQMPVVAPDVDPQGFHTEFAVEIYTPPYLSGDNANRRPTAITLSKLDIETGVSTFTISFTAPGNAQKVQVALYHGGFVTHAVHMSHRILFLETQGWKAGATEQTITVAGPPNNNVAPPGPYVVYVVVDGVPGVGQFVMVS